jgi:hypothetical protein
MATAQVVRLNTTAKSRKAITRTRRPSLRERLALGSATAIGAVAVGATALSRSAQRRCRYRISPTAFKTWRTSPAGKPTPWRWRST